MGKEETIKYSPRNPFEKKEIWSAREMATMFGYAEPDNFAGVIEEGLKELEAWGFEQTQQFYSEDDNGNFRIVIQKAILVGGFLGTEITKNFVYQSFSAQSSNSSNKQDDINLSPIAAWWILCCADGRKMRDM
jgi:hypothetical protein